MALDRQPLYAGTWYPAEPDRLKQAVDAYLDGAGVDAAPDAVAALIAPHAGHRYSGPTAGHAFARVRGKKARRVILLGGSHRQHIAHASVVTSGEFHSPLGPFPIDEAFAEAFADASNSGSPEPHVMEHSLEIQLPFLYQALGPVPIVPVLFSGGATEYQAALGQRLAEMTDDSDLVLASTDLSHYLPQNQAETTDSGTIAAVISGDYDALASGLGRGEYVMCGGAAVITAMVYAEAKGATERRMLDYRTSGDVTKDFASVVGYAAISMEWPV